jgi:hypothetical protein
MSIGELGQIVPQVDWARYLSLVLARPINISEPVVVFALNYIRKLVNLLSKTPPRWVKQISVSMRLQIGWLKFVYACNYCKYMNSEKWKNLEEKFISKLHVRWKWRKRLALTVINYKMFCSRQRTFLMNRCSLQWAKLTNVLIPFHVNLPVTILPFILSFWYSYLGVS